MVMASRRTVAFGMLTFITRLNIKFIYSHHLFPQYTILPKTKEKVIYLFLKAYAKLTPYLMQWT